MRGPPGDDGGADFDGADLDVLARKKLPLPRGGDGGRLAPPLGGPPRHCGAASGDGRPRIRGPGGGGGSWGRGRRRNPGGRGGGGYRGGGGDGFNGEVIFTALGRCWLLVLSN